MYSLHTPSVTVNCVDCYRYNHCKLWTKFFVRFMPQTDDSLIITGFPVRSVFSPSLWWGLIIRMPPGSLPLPPWGRTLRTIFIVRFVLRFLEAMQCRQRFLEVKSMPYRHRIGIHQIRTDPPILPRYTSISSVAICTSCFLLYHLPWGVHMCSIQCQRSNTSGMLCTVISAPRRLSRIVQCSQQP